MVKQAGGVGGVRRGELLVLGGTGTTCTSGLLVPFRSYSGGLDLRGLRSKSWAELLFCWSCLPAD